MGLLYRVRSSAETNWVFYRNVTFLDDYWRVDPGALIVDKSAAVEVMEIVIGEPGIRLDHLLQRLKTARSDDVYMMLVNGQIYVDLNEYPLAEPQRVPVFRDQWLARAHLIVPDTLVDGSSTTFHDIQMAVGELVSWAGGPWRIININDHQIWLRFESDKAPQNMLKLTVAEFNQLIDAGEIEKLSTQQTIEMSAEAHKILVQASPKALQRANDRYRMIVEPMLQGQPPLDTTSHLRTCYRYLANFRKAQAVHHCGYVGLIDQVHKQGNRLSKIPPDTRELMLKYVEKVYETKKQPKLTQIEGSS